MLIIDRFEDQYAVCECDNGEMVHIATRLIDGDPKEGDVLVQSLNLFSVDEAATEARKQKISGMMQSLFNKNKRQ